MTCMHCQNPQGKIYRYRTPIDQAGICESCVQKKARELDEYLSERGADWEMK